MALILGVGPFIAGGYLTTVLVTAGAGCGGRRPAGGLTGTGLGEDEARHYDEQFKAGRAVVTVNAGDRYTEAAGLPRDSGDQTYPPGAAGLTRQAPRQQCGSPWGRA